MSSPGLRFLLCMHLFFVCAFIINQEQRHPLFCSAFLKPKLTYNLILHSYSLLTSISPSMVTDGTRSTKSSGSAAEMSYNPSPKNFHCPPTFNPISAQLSPRKFNPPFPLRLQQRAAHGLNNRFNLLGRMKLDGNNEAAPLSLT